MACKKALIIIIIIIIISAVRRAFLPPRGDLRRVEVLPGGLAVIDPLLTSRRFASFKASDFPWAKKHSCRSIPGQLKKSPPNSKCKANANERQIKLRRNSSKEMFQNSSSSGVMFQQLRRYLNIKTTSDRSTFFV